MSNLTEGMDIGRIREIASQLTTQAGKVGEVSTSGTSQAGTLAENWLGADSDQFAEAWQGAAQQLQAAQDALQSYSKKALTQADQQEHASGGGA